MRKKAVPVGIEDFERIVREDCNPFYKTSTIWKNIEYVND